MQIQRISGSGGGGKSGGGGGGISEDPDTLSGVTRARYIDLISEGRIDGLVNGEQSVYLDGVALRGLTGTPNYRPFRWNFVPGTADQEPIPGFDGSSAEVAVSTQLTRAAGRIVRSVPDADADSVRINVSVPSLSLTSDKGKVTKTSVAFAIYGRRLDGSWVLLKESVIEGKTGSRYPRSVEVLISALAGTGAFEIGVERVTDDSASALLVNTLYWDSYTIINYERYSYPHSALFALEVDARYFSSVPTRSYHVRGLIVRVPTNYNPVTRTYTGVWDGTWKLAYTNNPAWCYYDLLTNPRYGLGRRIKDSQVNKWYLYGIAKYCDEMVPTGLSTNISDIFSSPGVGSGGATVIGVPQRVGPTEPRFTLNVVINTADDAYRVVNNLSSVFRGMTYWASSMVAVTQDRPASSSMTWTNANVIDNKFNYQGSSRAQRHTVVSVGWNDPNEDFRQRFEYVEDRDGIARYGVRSIEIVAFGCTSRSQARRVGLWLLYTGRMETDAITFKASLDSSQVVPGDVGQILDSKRVGARGGGRLISATPTGVTLDAPLTLSAGSYTLTTSGKDGKPVTRGVTVSATGTYTELTVGTAYTETPSPMAVWVLNSTAVSPVWVRVVSIRQIDPLNFEITVLKHNPTKYQAIDTGGRVETPKQSLLQRGDIPKVQGLVARETSYRTANSLTVITSIDASWDYSPDLLVRGYNVVIAGQGGPVLTVGEQSSPNVTLQNIDPGTYTVNVRSVSHLGALSSEVARTNVVVTGNDTIRPEDVRGFSATIIPGGVLFSWTRPTLDRSYLNTEIHIESAWDDETTPIFVGDATSFTWSWPPVGVYRALIKHRDTSSNLSLAAAWADFTISPTNTAIDEPNLSPPIQAALGAPKSLRVPEAAGIPALPDVNGRKSRVVAMDGSGNPVMIVGVDAGSAAALNLDLTDSSNPAKGSGIVQHNPHLTYAAGTVGFALNKRKAVFGTGVAATDMANLQETIDAAAPFDVIDLFGAFTTNGPIQVKPTMMIRNGGGAFITHTSPTNLFQHTPSEYWDSYPGQIKIIGLRIEGPGAPATGEPLGTHTWANGWAAVFIDANCPLVEVACDIRGFFAPVILNGCFSSRISGLMAACRHGPMVFGETHNVVFDNLFSTTHTLTAVSVNYGRPPGGPLQGATFVCGAYQDSAVGIWLEQCQGASGVGTTYFETNRTSDMVIGVNDGFSPGYERTANFTRFQGLGCGSRCDAPEPGWPGVNILINHSVDVTLRGVGFYRGSGASASEPTIKVTGGADRTVLEIAIHSSSNPYAIDDPSRVLIYEPGGRVRFGLGPQWPVAWFEGSTLVAGLKYDAQAITGTHSLYISAVGDIRIAAGERVRIGTSAKPDLLVIDGVENEVELRFSGTLNLYGGNLNLMSADGSQMHGYIDHASTPGTLDMNAPSGSVVLTAGENVLLQAAKRVVVLNLPSTDPHYGGQLWRASDGTLKVSGG